MSVAGNISDAISDVDLLITQQATELSEMLNDHRLEMFPPDAKKTLRPFQLAEVASMWASRAGT